MPRAVESAEIAAQILKDLLAWPCRAASPPPLRGSPRECPSECLVRVSNFSGRFASRGRESRPRFDRAEIRGLGLRRNPEEALPRRINGVPSRDSGRSRRRRASARSIAWKFRGNLSIPSRNRGYPSIATFFARNRQRSVSRLAVPATTEEPIFAAILGRRTYSGQRC